MQKEKKKKIYRRYQKLSLIFNVFLIIVFGLSFCVLAAPNDYDDDTVANYLDFDDDNDGILDADEKYCNESTQSISGSGAYKRSLHFFDWSGLNINANDMSGNTVHTAQFTHKGITYKAEMKNVSRSWNFPITAMGMSGYGSSRYNPAGSTEAIRMRFEDGSPHSTDSVTYDLVFSAERGGVSYPVKIAVFDAQLTNYNTTPNNWNEDLEFTTDGTNFTFLEEIGGYPNSAGAIVGENTQQITYNNTISSSTSTILPRNAMFYTRGENLTISTRADVLTYGNGPATQAATYAVVLNCDTDNDGTPDYLDLDSDNDSCPDALEGDGSLNQSNLNANGSINSPVDVNGIPTLIGAGQGVGNSQQATQLGIGTPLTDQTYQVNDTITFTITDAYYQTTQVFNAGTPNYSGIPQQTTSISYQWQVSTDNGASFSDMPGETNATLNLTGTVSMDGNIYRVMTNCTDKVCTEELTRAQLTKTNTAPVADSSTVTVDEESTDTNLGLSAPTDADGDTLTITVTGLPNLGTVTKADSTTISNGDTLTSAELTGLLYDAPTEYNGTDNVGDFTYSVSDGTATVNGATDITVNAINDPPTLTDDTANTQVNNPVSGNILTVQDTDPEGDALVVTTSPITGPSHGTITLNANGDFTYTPDTDYVGTDSVEIQVCDDVTPTPACATQSLNISIGTNTPPVITTHDTIILQGESLNLLDLVDSATDLEDGDITSNVTVQNDGGFDNNTPDTYTITYTVTDSDSNTVTNTATVEVQYTNVFDPPSAQKIITNSQPEMEWKMVWINDGNATALNTQVIDPIPTGTTYIQNSLTCDARGASTTSVCTYDSAENRVRWEGDIAPDPGGTNEDNSNNEVVIIFTSTVPDEINTIENQAHAYWDEDGSGEFGDDILRGQTPVRTDDPTTSTSTDPTTWRREGIAEGNSSIGNYIWHDKNSDGKQDKDEPGLKDIRVKLTWAGPDKKFGTSDDYVWRTETNKKGKYLFEDLPKGKYKVKVKEQDIRKYVQTYDPQGKMNNKAHVKLGNNDHHTKADFGYNTQEMHLAKTGDDNVLWTFISVISMVFMVWWRLAVKK
ncbi:MAG: hypothetical protein CR972_04245 [Candidatus Moraniibacteriota bacterium]|nr:MAG: hypothetical protein CR972_04245 [Candidatus Moranbacteria bacterium]